MSFFQEYLDDLVMEKIAYADEAYAAAKGQTTGSASAGHFAGTKYDPKGAAATTTDMELRSEILSRLQRDEAKRKAMLEKAKKYNPSMLEKAKGKVMGAHRYLAGKGKYVPHAVYGTAGLASAAGAYHLATRKKRRD